MGQDGMGRGAILRVRKEGGEQGAGARDRARLLLGSSEYRGKRPTGMHEAAAAAGIGNGKEFR